MVRNKEIDMLRGVAIILIVLWHSTVGFWSNDSLIFIQKFQKYFNSTTGVELFFVISGYYFARKFKDIDNEYLPKKAIFILSFYFKKFCRLYPTLFLWSIITLFIAGYSLGKDVALRQFISNISFSRNFYEATNPTFTGYFWFLALEMQFMLIYPIIRALLKRRITILFSIFLIILNAFYRPTQGWLFRYDEILFGYLLFEFFDLTSIHIINTLKPWFSCFITLFLILVLNSTLHFLDRYPNFMFSMSALTASILVFFAVQNSGFIKFPKLIESFFNTVGKYSFSLYICHIPVFLCVRKSFDFAHISYNYLGMICSILILSLITYLNYKFVESRDFSKLILNSESK